MNNLSKIALASAIASIVFISTTSGVMADQGVETRTECTTGAYGQQTCKTVEVKKVLGETIPTKHEVKNAGIAENIVFATMAVFALSSAGVVYANRE